MRESVGQFTKLVFIVYCCWSIVQLDRAAASSTGSPAGLKLRVSQAGLDYAGSVAVDVLTRAVRGLSLQDVGGTQRDRWKSVEGHLTNGRITEFNRPRSSVTVNPGSGLTWTIRRAAVKIAGSWSYRVEFQWFTLTDRGTYQVTVSDASISVTGTLGRSPIGQPTLVSTGCTCSLGDVHIDLSGGWSQLYSMFVNSYVGQLKAQLEPIICREARKAVDTNAAEQLATLQVRFPFLDHWVFDYSLVSAPLFADGYIETTHRGSFYRTGDDAQTPIPASTFPDAQAVTSRMVTMWMSDDVLNAIGRSLFRYSVLRYTYVLSMEQAMNNFGLVDLSDGSSIEVDLMTTEPPKVTIPVTAVAHGHIKIMVTVKIRHAGGSLFELFSAQINSTLAVSPAFNGSTLTATISNEAITARLIRSGDESQGPLSEVTDDQMSNLCSVLMRDSFLPKLNAAANRGIPVPYMEFVRFPNAALQLVEGGFVILTTDVNYQPE
jgi:hypothetical protein